MKLTNNKSVLLLGIFFIALFRRIEGLFDRSLQSPQKDMRRPMQGVCPACASPDQGEVASLAYYKVHRFMWGGGARQFFKIVPGKYWQAKFGVLICNECGLRFVGESYKNLTEQVEQHPLYLQETIKAWSDACHPHLSDEDIDLFESGNVPSDRPTLSAYRNVYNNISQYLNDDSSFLDIGSNVGTFSELVRNSNKKMEVFACEINRHYLEIGKRRYPQLNWIEKEISCDDANRKYDFIYASDVIEHIWDLDSFLKALKSAMPSGGHLMLVTPNPECATALMMGIAWPGFLLPHHCQLFTKLSMEKLLLRHGFAIVGAGDFGEEHWFVCKKSSQ